MLCYVVCPILTTRFPVHIKLTLTHSVSDPVKSHVNCFRPLVFHCSVDKAYYRGVMVAGVQVLGEQPVLGMLLVRFHRPPRLLLPWHSP